MLTTIWRALKIQRRVAMGPLMLTFQWGKSTRLVRSRTRRTGRPALDAGTPRQPLASNERPAEASTPPSALLFGVGPGLGEALMERLDAEGFRLGVVSRNAGRLQGLLDRLPGGGRHHRAYACDVTLETSVDQAFSQFKREFGAPSLVIYALHRFGPGTLNDIEVPAFEEGLRHNCFGAFLVSRQACRAMAEAGHGTLLLVGSTSSIIGRAEHLNLVAGKFGQRGMAQVLAREMWPRGVHVAHVMIDADIREQEGRSHPQSEPHHIAETLLFLHRQPKSAWTSELDLRPWNERFWEHC